MTGLFVVFVLVAVSVLTEWSLAWDRWLVRSLRHRDDVDVMIGPVWLPGVMRDLTSLAGIGLVVVLGLTLQVYLLLRRWWMPAVVMVFVVVTTQASVSLLKLLFSRPRPDFITPGQEMFTNSFPSGHAALGAALALTAAWSLVRLQDRLRLRIFVWVCAVGYLLIIGFTRMYLGVHFPTDVLAGWCIGGFWGLAGWRLYGVLARPREASPVAADPPSTPASKPTTQDRETGMAGHPV